eukprot:COSAG02_NODE_3361_length_6869_cov_128.775923_5_plen_56_part_00
MNDNDNDNVFIFNHKHDKYYTKLAPAYPMNDNDNDNVLWIVPKWILATSYNVGPK